MRIIGHLDMDAFFAAIEERDKPRFRGFPIVIGADPREGKGRGVVSTANYKAREYGIHSAMPITKSWQLSQNAKSKGHPEAIFLQPNFHKYEDASRNIAEIARQYVSKIEEASIDEFYLDLSFAGGFEAASRIARKIKSEIKEKETLTASVGIGPNKLIAKIASDMQKPDGLTAVTEGEAEAFLEPLPLRKIPGIGPKTEEMFLKMGMKHVGDLKKFSESELHEILGKWGIDLYQKIRGIDDSPIVEEHEAKSIGEQETFLKDVKDSEFIFDRIKKMCNDVIYRLNEEKFKEFRAVAVTVRFADFETKSRSHTLTAPARSANQLEFEVIKLILPFLDKRENPRGKLIRLVGVRVEKLQ